MLIKLYIHPNKLEALQKGEAVIAKTMTASQYDVEILVNTKKVKLIYQTKGVLIQKRNLLRRIFKKAGE